MGAQNPRDAGMTTRFANSTIFLYNEFESEIKTLADIQKAEDHDLDSVRKDTSLSSSSRQKAIAQIRMKYDQMRKDARLAANKAGKMDYKNEQKAKANELKAEKSQTPIGQ